MVANLIEKHGVIPKKCFPETFSNESSRQMNNILKSKMREFAHDLYNATKKEASETEIKAMIKSQMDVIYRYEFLCYSQLDLTENLHHFQDCWNLPRHSTQDFYLGIL